MAAGSNSRVSRSLSFDEMISWFVQKFTHLLDCMYLLYFNTERHKESKGNIESHLYDRILFPGLFRTIPAVYDIDRRITIQV